MPGAWQQPVVQLALVEVVALGVVPVLLGGEEPLEEVDPLEALAPSRRVRSPFTFSPDPSSISSPSGPSSYLVVVSGFLSSVIGRSWSCRALSCASGCLATVVGLDAAIACVLRSAAISRAAPSKPPAFDERGPSLPSTGARSARGAFGSGGLVARHRLELRVDLQHLRLAAVGRRLRRCRRAWRRLRPSSGLPRT